jgi:peptidoglycan/xylan/chitin deacetylase (PgdA/CDA1 family)
MTVGIHDRLTGRPGRASGLERFLDHVMASEGVWVCRGIALARHWIEHHPYPRTSTGTGDSGAAS